MNTTEKIKALQAQIEAETDETKKAELSKDLDELYSDRAVEDMMDRYAVDANGKPGAQCKADKGRFF